jgi:RNA recognition motif-containing protein
VNVSNRLYVGNVAFGTTEMDLRNLFEEVGSVAEVKVMLDRQTGRPRGFAFVEMSSDTEAHAAIVQFNGRELDGRALKVNEAESRLGGGVLPAGGAFRDRRPMGGRR